MSYGESSPAISPTHKHDLIPNLSEGGYYLNFADKRRGSIGSSHGS